MKIRFHIPYRAAQDETLCAVLLLQTGHALLRRRVPLQCLDGEHWSGTTEILPAQDAEMAYSYKVMRGEHTVRREWNAVARCLFLSAARETYDLYDLWRDLPEKSWLYSSVLAQDIYPQKLPEYPSTIVLRAQIPGLTQGQKPHLCAAAPQLGGWDPQNAVPLVPVGINEWAVSLNAAELSFPLAYKFILKEDSGLVQWELGDNRLLHGPAPADGETVIYSNLYPRFSLPQPRAAGVVLPVFSIRTENDWGAGDFGSLKKLADWAALTGQKVIQLLPVNDTVQTGTWTDSYPYSCVSVYAFHPMYADVSALPKLSAREEKYFQTRRARLNAAPQMDYEGVCKLKNERLRLAYKKQGQEVLASEAFKEFWDANNNWLAPYAMFCALRDRFGTADWHSWPRHAHFSEKEMKSFFSVDSKDRQNAHFYFYVQFLLHTQLLDAHRYAREKGVALKGDIPIGVSPHGADAWAEPALFHLDAQAGAPPDDFSEIGQNWCLPTYNWEEMAKDGYGWWRRRFLHMSRYFDAYRIDHVLGFFRIWEIPMYAVQGILGQFSPALPLSAREISFAGLPFDQAYLRPYISDGLLQELFGEYAEFVKQHFLLPAENGLYALRPEYDTQRKIHAAFSGQTDERAQKIRDGLYTLAAEVLFLPDRRDPQLYHPRIGALKSAAFRALSRPQQQAYEQLYNDYFYRRQDDFWKQEALKKLPAVTQATRMLCCAEDLGMIPHCVPEVMHALQMLSLEIQRMPKRMGETFAKTENYPYLSVATPGTHDMSVLRAWWRENPSLTEKFWREELHRPGTPPAQMPADVCEQILQMHLQSPSMLCLISFQDWTAMYETLRAPDPEKERINVPAVSPFYWRYRMHLPLEELMKQEHFNRKIRQMIWQSGR